MLDLQHKKILLGITGSIAAFKIPLLIRQLRQLGAEIRVVLTESAKQFVTSLTLQALTHHTVRCDRFDIEAEQGMSHIELARWADYLLIAPASANCLAKLATGLCDDLLTTLYVASDKPKIICPAMNKIMWQHPTTQENCSRLISHGVLLVGPEEGIQACGDEGFGRMADISDIIDALRLYDVKNLLSGEQVMVTAGGTQEALDPVRYISNHSSGKMGYALAKAAKFAGADVTLISGPSHLTPPLNINCINVVSGREMHEEVMRHFQSNMIFIGCAAVADYGIKYPAPEKIKKTPEDLMLTLTPNPDIIKAVASSSKAKRVIGFAAETSNLLENARRKLVNKGLDVILANLVGPNCGFNEESNTITVLTQDKEIALPRMNKTLLAGKIIAILAASLHNIPSYPV